tara:strand:- start:565 stop:867 length:303 start_codon:yes stop_codon:yes gene_type:complete
MFDGFLNSTPRISFFHIQAKGKHLPIYSILQELDDEAGMEYVRDHYWDYVKDTSKLDPNEVKDTKDDIQKTLLAFLISAGDDKRFVRVLKVSCFYLHPMQ